MFELSLYALVPNNRKPQLLKVLLGICNMNPVPEFSHHLIFKPKRPKPIQNVASNSEMCYLHLVSKIDEAAWEEKRKKHEERLASEKEEKKGQEDVIMIDLEGSDSSPVGGAQKQSAKLEEPLYDIRKQKWTIEFKELPESMRSRPVTTRAMHLAPVHDGDVLAFMEDLGYTYVAEYVTSGHVLYHHDLIISMAQTFIPKTPNQPLPRENLRNIDPAQAWVCQVSMNIPTMPADNKQLQADTINAGVVELKKFQNLVRGAGLELEMGERLALDTRVK